MLAVASNIATGNEKRIVEIIDQRARRFGGLSLLTENSGQQYQ
jgi:hypothetical protein